MYTKTDELELPYKRYGGELSMYRMVWISDNLMFGDKDNEKK